MKQYFNLATYFYTVAKENREQDAIVYRDRVVSYEQLNRLSNQLARYFLSIGIAARDVVCIVNTKDVTGYAAMLACLKIGAIYTNIDEDNPPVRSKKILSVCKPKIIVSDCDISDAFIELTADLGVKTLDLRLSDRYSSEDNDDLDLSYGLTGSCPAYIMFTSGSTGTPKGVLVSHSNIMSFLGWSINKYKVTSDDRFAQVSPIYFDNSVFDFYTALFGGASMVPVSKSVSKDPVELIQLVDDLKCTIWFSVPSLLVYLSTMRVLTREKFKTIRVFTFGGEGFPKVELKKLYDLYGDRAELINVYGPTEGTCICSSHDITDEDFLDMGVLAPLGKINPGFDSIIVDGNHELVDDGTKGELCLIGPNVSLGYYNDPDRTSDAFIQNPLVTNYKDTIYKTGDIVYENKGMLWFSGRADNQVKHMGYRIELEEIESALNSLNYVKQSAVIYDRVRENYGKIIAFVSSEKNVSESMVLDDLHEILPDYMVPNVIEIKKELTKNANGKIDKKHLLDTVRDNLSG